MIEKEIFRSGRRSKAIDIVKGKDGFWIRLMKKRTLIIQSAIILVALLMGYITPTHPRREERGSFLSF